MTKQPSKPALSESGTEAQPPSNFQNGGPTGCNDQTVHTYRYQMDFQSEKNPCEFFSLSQGGSKLRNTSSVSRVYEVRTKIHQVLVKMMCTVPNSKISGKWWQWERNKNRKERI